MSNFTCKVPFPLGSVKKESKNILDNGLLVEYGRGGFTTPFGPAIAAVPPGEHLRSDTLCAGRSPPSVADATFSELFLAEKKSKHAYCIYVKVLSRTFLVECGSSQILFSFIYFDSKM